MLFSNEGICFIKAGIGNAMESVIFQCGGYFVLGILP